MRRPTPDKGEEAIAGIYDKSEAHRLIASDQAPFHSARDISGGGIILKTRRRQLAFLGGLIAFVIFALVAALLAPH